MRLAALGSGSRGNGLLVRQGSTCILVDCGFSLRSTEQRLAQLGVAGRELDGILVTHEHSDHSKGVRALSEKYGIPVFLTHGSARHSSLAELRHERLIGDRVSFEIGELEVRAVTVPHDALEPCQFLFEAAGRRLGVLTDLGHASTAVEQAYAACDALFLEANHDERMLAEGSYPPALKRRVGGNWGHLSNRQCSEFLLTLDLARLRQLVLGHISEQNNSPELVAASLPAEQLTRCRVTYARQNHLLDWIDV